MAVGALAFIALWLVFQHKPGWYRPPVVDEALLRRARTESAALVDDVSRQIVEARPFDVTLTDAEVSEWLAAAPHQWPDVGRRIPPQISDPVVRFEPDGVRFGVLYSDGGWRAVLNATVALGVSDDSEHLTIALLGVRGGSLPVPRFVLEGILNEISIDGDTDLSLHTGASVSSPARAAVDTAGSPHRRGEHSREPRPAEGAGELILIENRFIWPNGDRPFQIKSISVEFGSLHLRVVPL